MVRKIGLYRFLCNGVCFVTETVDGEKSVCYDNSCAGHCTVINR